MTIAFISDLHLTPERPHSNQLFADFIGQSAGHLKQLYILGDLFEYWIGDDAGGQLGYAPVEDAVRQTRQAGTEVLFMHGNRDFLVGQQFAERTGCRLLDDPCVVQLGEHRTLLTHGDSLCTDDVQYQQARQTLRSAKWKTTFEQQPIAQRITDAMALRQKSEASKQNKSMEIMDVNQAAVEACMREHGVYRMIHGHTHRPAVHEFELDGKSARRYVLGAWFSKKSVLFYTDGCLTLR